MSAARRHLALGIAGIVLAAGFSTYVVSGLGGHPGGPFQVTVTFARVGQLLRVSGDVKLALDANIPGVMVFDPDQQQFVDPMAAGFYFPDMVMDLTNVRPGAANRVAGRVGHRTRDGTPESPPMESLPRLVLAG